MNKSSLFKSATRSLRLPLTLLAFSLAPAFVDTSLAQATGGANPRPQQDQIEPHRAAATPAPNSSREAPARSASAEEQNRAAASAPQGSASAPNFALLQLLVASAATLGAVAVAMAFLLARTRSRLDVEQSQKEALEKDFDALYNRVPLGYHTLDLSGAVVDMNDTEISWLGYTRDEIVGKKYAEFLDETSWGAFSENYTRLLRSDRPEAMEHKYRIVGRNGKVRSLSLTPSLVRNEGGSVIKTRWAAVDISETVRLEQALDTEAHFDRVTNAHNRTFFFTLAEREIARARRLGAHLTLLYVDIEDFTRINSIYGHFAGDKVLRAVCGVIAQGLRNVDVFARVGDDEFAILLPDTGGEGATIVAERLRTAIASTPVTLSSDDALEVRALIGIGEYSASTPDLDSLLTAGERALEEGRRAKRKVAAEPTEDIEKTVPPIASPAT